MKPTLWADQTWETLAAMRTDGVDMVLFPIGGVAQHGPHLPLGTDNITAEIVAHAVSARTAVPVLPTLPFGCALGQTRHWPGTLSLSPETLSRVVCEILGDAIAYGFTRVLMMSGDAGSAAPLGCALELLRARFPTLQIAHKAIDEVSAPVKAAFQSDATQAHAGAAETAIMLHLAPQLVRRERMSDQKELTRDLVFDYAASRTSLQGHVGAPSLATPEMGAELFEQLVRDWTFWVKRALIETAPLN